jgi:hypothetical protein
MTTCPKSKCVNPIWAKGLCSTHYLRNRVWDPESAYYRTHVVIDGDECHLWTGQVDQKGYAWYGRLNLHRRAYEDANGPIPQGLVIDHLCRVRHCINPEHLEAVTQRENNLRGNSPAAINARKTHCLRGHAFDEENTYVSPTKGGRSCRECTRMHSRKYKSEISTPSCQKVSV